MRQILFSIFFLSLIFSKSYSCTTFIITKGASADGSIMVGHTDDDDVGDQRIIRIPQKSHPVKSKKALYIHSTNYPREVTSERTSFYHQKKLDKSKPIGYIDEVPQTYSYIEGNYGIMNEHQLTLGECTDSTRFYFEADPEKRIVDITTLAQLAMERCKTAKEAILLMGEIAEKNGYFGFGETLPIADKEEAWVFEISCSPNGEGAIWVAKKIPDGEIFVAANQFRIQVIDPNDPNILYSKNLFEIAKTQNWLDKMGTLNWQKSVCPGEFDHPYYSLRRVWRVQSLVAPSQKLNPYVEGPYTSNYPFSIKPDKPITFEKAKELFRDHYEGTEFDLTKGMAAGPYGCPHRYLGTYDTTDFPDKRTTPLEGAWERSISIYFTGYSYIAQIRANLPDPIGGLIWLGLDEPATTCYMPIYIGVLGLAKNLEKGDPQKLDKIFAWWPFNIANNWVSYFYGYAAQDILDKQKEIEKRELEEIVKIDSKALKLYKQSPEMAKKYLTKYSKKNVTLVVKEWWKLTDHLIEKFTDGFINKPKVAQRVGYPKFWLDDVGYRKGPVSYQKK